MNRIRCSIPNVVVEYHRPRSLYCQAIRSGRLVAINYAGWRVIEPLFHGFNAKGEGQLFAFQRHGATSSGRAAGLRTFTIDKITDVGVDR